MGSNYLLSDDDLVNNPTPRLAICLCLDTSGSMGEVEGDCIDTGRTEYIDGKTYNIVTGGTSRIDELQKGVEHFFNSIKNDDIAKYAAEISIVTFDDDIATLIDFGSIEKQGPVGEFKLGRYNTLMGEGVNLALDMLEKRKRDYKSNGVDYYQPWLVLMTDGVPNGDKAELDRAVTRTANLVNSRKLTVFPIAIGNETDMSTLNSFSPKRPALKLKGLNFTAFFEWLSKSVSKTSQSNPGDTVKLDTSLISTFATLD